MASKSETVTLNGPTSSTESRIPVLTYQVLTLVSASHNCTSDHDRTENACTVSTSRCPIPLTVHALSVLSCS